MVIKSTKISNGVDQNHISFTVLMSIYKNENPNFLDQALTSIENQTLQPDEIILVEDGPLGKELHQMIRYHQELFKDKNNFKVYSLKNNHGLGYALQIGAKQVTTDWIARMDTDDIAAPNRFALQIKRIMQEPQLSVLGGQIDEFINTPENVVGTRNVPLTDHDIKQFIKWRAPFNHPTVMIKRADLMSVGGYRPCGSTYEDYDLWSRFIGKGYRTANLPDILLHMRVDESMYKRRGQLGNIRSILHIQNYLRKHGILTSGEMFLSDIIQVGNMVVPTSMRKWVYQRLIHKGNK